MEWCPLCEKEVWSYASHCFTCPKVHPDQGTDERDAWHTFEDKLREYVEELVPEPEKKRRKRRVSSLLKR